MTHNALLQIGLTVHGMVLLGALAAWYKYGVGSEVQEKSLERTESTLSKLRMMISDELLTTIKTKLPSVPIELRPIIGPDGKTSIYSERVTNFLESERFREAINDFIDHKVGVISDYRELIRARDNLCLWARILSWSVWLVIILQILSLVLQGYIDMILGKEAPDWSIHGSLAITCFLVLFVICVPSPILLRSQNAIIQKRVKYDAR
jgi:hypothetical protein